LIFEIVASLVIFTTSAALAVSLKKNIEYMEKLEEVGQSLQMSIDLLEIQYEKLNKKSKIELFSDEPVVRDLVIDIAEAKEAVIVTARLLDGVLRTEETEEIE
jgi:hypothetical protein